LLGSPWTKEVFKTVGSPCVRAQIGVPLEGRERERGLGGLLGEALFERDGGRLGTRVWLKSSSRQEIETAPERADVELRSRIGLPCRW
jgi:hypothetical protein